MEHLLNNWEIIRDELHGRDPFLFLDYDGTLSPIANSPSQAVLPIKTRRIIEELVLLLPNRIVIISGRSAADLKRIFKMQSLIYIGNHGWEINETTGYARVRQKRAVRYAMWTIHKELLKKLFDIPGVIVENKTYTLSIHYRMVSPVKVPHVQNVVREITKNAILENLLQLREGKKVIEVTPSGEWNKGAAAKVLLERLLISNKRLLPICIGDDVTDEDLFSAFREEGITVKVGNDQNSMARYYVENTMEVQALLISLLESLNERKN